VNHVASRADAGEACDADVSPDAGDMRVIQPTRAQYRRRISFRERGEIMASA
jgi:hypothetical protein